MTPDSIDIKSFIRPDLLSLGGYATHKSPDTLSVPREKIIKIDANENPYGVSPGTQKAIAEYKDWNIYPDAGQTRLRALLQEYTGVPAANIVLANGSGEVLDEILRLLLEPGDEVINCLPTFDLYRFRVLINRGKVVGVPRLPDFSVDVKAVRAAVTPKTKLIVIANPNNPTGNLTSRQDVLKLLETGVPVLIDEAYYEFCGDSVADLVGKYPNLMVLRTFSKWAGLAGLRIGYGLLPAEIAGFLMLIKLPYNVNLAAQVAVEQSLKDKEYLLTKVQAIINERAVLSRELEKLGWMKLLPSRANYIFAFLLKGQAKEICQTLQQQGILVRYFDQPRLQNGIRFSVGTPEYTTALVKALKKLEVK